MRRQRYAFDLDDTMSPAAVYYHRAIWECGNIIHEAIGRTCPHPKDLIDFQQKLDIQRMTVHEFHPHRFPSSWVMVYEHFAQVAGQLVDPVIAAAIYQAANRFQAGPFYALPGVIETLRALREQGHDLFIISAGRQAEELQCRKIRDCGLDEFFSPDHIFFSGLDKSPEMQQVFDGHRNISWMIGDSKKHDIRSAKKFRGVTTVWVPSSSWSFQHDRVKPHFTIQVLTDLLGLSKK